jgi:hypothetical protein
MSEKLKPYYPVDEDPFINQPVEKPILDGRLKVEDEAQAVDVIYAYLDALPVSSFQHPDSGYEISPIHYHYALLDIDAVREDLALGDSASYHSVKLLGVETILSRN